MSMVTVWKIVYKTTGMTRFCTSVDHNNDFVSRNAGRKYMRKRADLFRLWRLEGTVYRLVKFTTVTP